MAMALHGALSFEESLLDPQGQLQHNLELLMHSLHRLYTLAVFLHWGYIPCGYFSKKPAKRLGRHLCIYN